MSNKNVKKRMSLIVWRLVGFMLHNFCQQFTYYKGCKFVLTMNSVSFNYCDPGSQEKAVKFIESFTRNPNKSKPDATSIKVAYQYLEPKESTHLKEVSNIVLNLSESILDSLPTNKNNRWSEAKVNVVAQTCGSLNQAVESLLTMIQTIDVVKGTSQAIKNFKIASENLTFIEDYLIGVCTIDAARNDVKHMRPMTPSQFKKYINKYSSYVWDTDLEICIS